MFKNSPRRIILIVSIIFVLITGVSLIWFIPQWVGHTDTKMTKARFSIWYLQQAIEQYYKDHGQYPNTEEGLSLLIEHRNQKGEKYLDRLFNDPWGNSYHYRYPGVHNKDRYDLWTYGADNAPNGDNENADITNWGEKGVDPYEPPRIKD